MRLFIGSWLIHLLPLKAQSLREVEGDLARDVGWLTIYIANETKGFTRYTYVDIPNVSVRHVLRYLMAMWS